MNESAKTNAELLDRVIAHIFGITNPHVDEARKKEIHDFIETTINGDTAKAELTIDVKLGTDKKGIYVYILTNQRLINVQIVDKEITSASYILTTMTAVERKLDAGRASIQISFQNGSLGLTYSPSNKEIVDFFQKVDQVRAKQNG